MVKMSYFDSKLVILLMYTTLDNWTKCQKYIKYSSQATNPSSKSIVSVVLYRNIWVSKVFFGHKYMAICQDSKSVWQFYEVKRFKYKCLTIQILLIMRNNGISKLIFSFYSIGCKVNKAEGKWVETEKGKVKLDLSFVKVKYILYF